MKILITAFLAVWGLGVNAQTVVIVKKTKEGIYAGADSRAAKPKTEWRGQQKVNVSYDTSTMCKIFSLGMFNAAFIGDLIDYNIKYAMEVGARSKSFFELTENFRKTYRQFLTEHLRNLQLTDPWAFKYLIIESGNAISQTIFFGYQSDTARIAHIVFSASYYGQFSPFKVRDTLVEDDLCFGGHIREIGAALQKEKTWASGPVNTIISMIEKQSNRYKMFVGGDIDILLVTLRERKWIQRKEMCTE